MFEVTPDDIALLNDTDLRTLVRMLAEAELRSRGLSSSHVMAGGAQEAVDDGVDVHVELPPGTQLDGFVPRPDAVFQVKDTEMPPAKIRKEMRPSNVSARPVIVELARKGGAYIIASSESVTYPMQKARLAAMAEAVQDVPEHENLHMDFYDRTRLGTWVGNHPSLVPWIQERIGKAIPGWRPFGPWAYPGEGVDAEYLVGDDLRIMTSQKEDNDGLDAIQGIEHIRTLLSQPGKIVRLVGLSGVGKTRFLQALFDARIGQGALDPALAIYTNTSDNPEPQPRTLATNLVTAGARAVLVIDNCTRELHRSLTEVCRAQASKLSLITVEHDVRDDTPEGTDVFTLEPSSANLIEKLIAQRFPEMSSVSVRTIAENSDGNARIAIALAGTVGQNETISTLPDEELFRRLFQQGHGHDDSLLVAAQAMSLVYSFDGENISDDGAAELVRLGGMVSKTAQDMYHHAATLFERDLVQRRGVFRALLPHALANRLAKTALKSIPPSIVDAHLVKGAPARLLRSFSRRLGYLSDSAEALSIVTKWLAEDGLLTDVANLNSFGKEIFQNVASVAPEAALAAIERTFSGPNRETAAAECRYSTRLLRLLAYEPKMFERCAALLVAIADTENTEGNNSEAARNVFQSMFPLYLSGTHATVEQRLAVIKPLLLSADPKRQNLGLKCLGASLEGMHFGSAYDFKFGSRVRDHGFWPKSGDEVRHWYRVALTFATELASSDMSCATSVRQLIGSHFRGLWTSAWVYDELEETCKTIAAKSFWEDGWIAVRETQGYDGAGFSPEVSARLSALEQLLRPKDVLETVLAVVLGDDGYSYDLVDSEDEEEEGDSSGTKAIQKRINATDAKVASLGKSMADDPRTFAALIDKLLTGKGHLWHFGRGLAEGQDPRDVWAGLKDQIAKTARDVLNVQVVRGFLAGLHKRDVELCRELLDKAVENETLAYWYPALEGSVDIEERGAARLMRALSAGKAPIRMYNALVWGGVTKTVPPQAMKDLVLEIASKEDGLPVAIEVLYMRLHNETEPPAELQEAGWNLLERIPFTSQNQHEDYRLAKIAAACIRGPESPARVTQLCARLKQAVSQHETHITYYDDFLGTLLNVAPKAALDAFCGGEDSELDGELSHLEDVLRIKSKLFAAIGDEALLAWCDEKPEIRYPAFAGTVPISTSDGETKEHEWSPIALRLLDRAPDRIEVVKRYVTQIASEGGWGSRAANIEAKAKLLDKLSQYSDPGFVAFVAEEKVRLAEYIERERRSEAVRDRRESGSFE